MIMHPLSARRPIPARIAQYRSGIGAESIHIRYCPPNCPDSVFTAFFSRFRRMLW